MTTLTRIPFIRSVSNDKRLTKRAIEAVLAKTSLSPLTRRAACDAFDEGGLLGDGQVKAATAVDGEGRYSLKDVDAALAKLPMAARFEIKNVLARCSLI
jgi:hypothetical protein